MRVCWKPSMNLVEWCKCGGALAWEWASSRTSSARVRGWSSLCFMSMSHGRSTRASTIIDSGQPCGIPAGWKWGWPKCWLNELYMVKLFNMLKYGSMMILGRPASCNMYLARGRLIWSKHFIRSAAPPEKLCCWHLRYSNSMAVV